MNKKQVLFVNDDTALVKLFKYILLDVGLPDIRGDEVAIQMKKDYDVEIILITGCAYFQKCIDTLNSGISNILLKPIAPKKQLNTVKETLSKDQVDTFTNGQTSDCVGLENIPQEIRIKYQYEGSGGY